MSSAHRKALLDVLNGHAPEHRPIWMMRQAGRYLPEYKRTRSEAGSFLDLCYSPKLAEEVTLQPLRRFDFDAAILFADILLIPHAMGQDVGFKEGEGPVLAPIRSGGDLAALSSNRQPHYLESVCETVSRLSQSLPKHVTLIGFCGAPWTVATYMIEGGTSRDRKNARIAAWQALGDTNHWFNRLMEELIEQSISYLKSQASAGAEVLQIFETWASDLPPALFGRYCCEPVGQIISGVRKDYPDIPIIGFPRAAGVQISRFVEQTGVTGVGIDSSLDLADAKRFVQGKAVLQGNLDPLCLLTGGDVLRSETQKIIAAVSANEHIFNLGHGILPETPIENVEAMIAVVRASDG
ncbi:MAG: uroporphyrinogen decarboxylase [Hyphomicrobiales bacterium]